MQMLCVPLILWNTNRKMVNLRSFLSTCIRSIKLFKWGFFFFVVVVRFSLQICYNFKLFALVEFSKSSQPYRFRQIACFRIYLVVPRVLELDNFNLILFASNFITTCENHKFVVTKFYDTLYMCIWSLLTFHSGCPIYVKHTLIKLDKFQFRVWNSWFNFLYI